MLRLIPLVVFVLAWAPLARAHTCEGEGGELVEVVTMNTWGLPPPLAPNRRARLPRIDRLLRDGDYDIVGLQEVWNGARRLFGRDLHLPDEGGDSGLALMSEHHTVDVRQHRFRSARGVDALKGKGFLDARVELPVVGPVRVIVTHMQAGHTEKAAQVRSDQVAQLLEHLEGIARAEVPVLLMGDLNLYDDLERDVLTARKIAQADLVDVASELGAERSTYGSQRARLDRVYVRCSDAVCLHPEMALALAELELLSDHRPVHVRLRAHLRRSAVAVLPTD